MNEEEKVTFIDLFEDYYSRVTKDHSSLLARIYGIYSVKIEKLQPVYLILMGNSVQI